MYYQIKETLVEATLEECLQGKSKYVAILTVDEWHEKKDQFEMGIDLDITIENDITKAEVNYDSLTGSFSIPNRENISGPRAEFAFALDERGIVLIDRGNSVQEIVNRIKTTKKWRLPSLERFIYDLAEQIVKNDLPILEKWETKMEEIESRILHEEFDGVIEEMNDIRGDLLDLRTHYEQLIDLGQELEENENDFFAEENLRYFHLFTVRVERLRDQLIALRDYSMQIRDLYHSQMDVKQNSIMSVLTVITTLFFPLSIITGWYGMNFVHMPELEYAWSYPVLALICLVIVGLGLLFFKKKHWL